ncbi:uncharacterized protein BDW70DRAFT_159149 [Aspergillus foveolatus]|uniref:uncharacterized protein n=1 Tax=Aspergillus foveolatus TaxID=210207 RepID=UPI003CCD5F5C
MAKYIEATAASSTATLAASNAATNYATATKYMWTALEAITKTAAGRMDAVTCAAIIGGCLVGAETAASEATKAAENARAVAAIAKEAASAATENDYLDASGWVLSDSFSAGTDNISVLDCEEFETDSVLAEWTALKAGWARYPGEGEVEDEDTEYNTSCSTRSYASLGALAHDETNEAQHPCLSCLESLQNLLCPKIDLGSQIGE